MSVRHAVSEFVAVTRPALRVVIPTAPGTLGAAVYSLQDWARFAGDSVFAESMMPTSEKIDVQFVYRPHTRALFWATVKKWQLPVFDFLGPAALGLSLPLGGAWRPKAVIYDVQAALSAFRASFRDPINIRERRREAEVVRRFRQNVLELPFRSKAPVFVQASAAVGF